MRLQRFILLSVSLLAIKTVPLLEANGRGVVKDDYSYSYEYDGGGSSYDYRQKPIDTRIPCYSCMYIFYQTISQGAEGCSDPFDSRGIPEVMCNGTCGLTMVSINNWTQYSIVRGCVPNCREVSTADMITRCCHTRLCNDFKSSSATLNIGFSVIVLLGAVASFIQKIVFGLYQL